MFAEDLLLFTNLIDRCSTHCVAFWRVAAVSPIDQSVIEIEIQIDRLRQFVEEQFDVGAIRRTLPFWYLEIGAEDTAVAGIVATFLSPVDLASIVVDCDPDAPFLSVAAWTGVTPTRCPRGFVHCRVDVRT